MSRASAILSRFKYKAPDPTLKWPILCMRIGFSQLASPVSVVDLEESYRSESLNHHLGLYVAYINKTDAGGFRGYVFVRYQINDNFQKVLIFGFCRGFDDSDAKRILSQAPGLSKTNIHVVYSPTNIATSQQFSYLMEMMKMYIEKRNLGVPKWDNHIEFEHHHFVKLIGGATERNVGCNPETYFFPAWSQNIDLVVLHKKGDRRKLDIFKDNICLVILIEGHYYHVFLGRKVYHVVIPHQWLCHNRGQLDQIQRVVRLRLRGNVCLPCVTISRVLYDYPCHHNPLLWLQRRVLPHTLYFWSYCHHLILNDELIGKGWLDNQIRRHIEARISKEPSPEDPFLYDDPAIDIGSHSSDAAGEPNLLIEDESNVNISEDANANDVNIDPPTTSSFYENELDISVLVEDSPSELPLGPSQVTKIEDERSLEEAANTRVTYWHLFDVPSFQLGSKNDLWLELDNEDLVSIDHTLEEGFKEYCSFDLKVVRDPSIRDRDLEVRLLMVILTTQFDENISSPVVVFIDTHYMEGLVLDHKNLLTFSKELDKLIEVAKGMHPSLVNCKFIAGRVHCGGYLGETHFHMIAMVVLLRKYMSLYDRLPYRLIYPAYVIKGISYKLVLARKLSNLRQNTVCNSTRLIDPCITLPHSPSIVSSGLCPYCPTRKKGNFSEVFRHIATAKVHGGQASRAAEARW